MNNAHNLKLLISKQQETFSKVESLTHTHTGHVVWKGGIRHLKFTGLEPDTLESWREKELKSCRDDADQEEAR